MLRPALLPLLLAPLALHAQPAVTAWPAPDGSPAEALCVGRHASLLCRHPHGDDPGFTFTLEHGAREVARWEARGWVHTGFRVFDADLGDGGRGALIVANNDAVSNGLGVAYWTLYLLREDAGAWAPAASIPVEEFGPQGGSFAEDDGLVLWATAWLDGPDPSGRRGPGLYFVGRPFRIADGRLVPAADLPIRARRLLSSFAEERSHDDPAAPASWLADRRAETRATDPYLLGGETSSFAGTVETVTPVAAEYGATNWELLVRPDAGEPIVYTYASGYGPDVAYPFRYFGDAATGRLYPPGYLVADPAAWLSGRRVRAATYARTYEPQTVLWLG